MASSLSLSEMTENQRKAHLQIITDKTKIDAHHECLVSVSDCEDSKVVIGHLIPKAWLRVIAEDNQVMAFATAPVHIFRDEEDEEFLLSVTKRQITQTLIGRFSCEEHEKIFFPADQRALDITDITNLNLLLYRSIIAQMWAQRRMVRAWDALLSEVPNDKVARLTADTYRDNCTGLSHYKAQAEHCLFPNKCATCNYGSKQCVNIVHEIRELPGDPVLAVAQFSDGNRTITRNSYDWAEQIPANWGITIIPTSSGHTVVKHYFAEEKLIWGKENSLWPNLQKKSGKDLEETVSLLVLDYCENIAMDPKHWDKFGKKRQRAIRERFTETLDTPFGSLEKMRRQAERQLPTHFPEYAPNRRLLNLFRADRMLDTARAASENAPAPTGRASGGERGVRVYPHPKDGRRF